MLWHLLRERQLELHLPFLKQPAIYKENTDALKYLINLAQSDREARIMTSQRFLDTPIYEIICWHDKPNLQVLACTLLQAIVSKDDLRQLFKYVPVLVQIIQNTENNTTESALLVAACKVLSVLGSEGFLPYDRMLALLNLGPTLITLMTNNNPDLQSSGFLFAGTIATGDFSAMNSLVNIPGFWPALTEGLSNKLESIRKDTVWILSNIAAESYGPHIGQVNTEEMFQRLLALRSDTADVVNEVVWTFANLGDLHYHQMNEAEQYLWQKYFDELLQLCQIQLTVVLQKLDVKKSAGSDETSFIEIPEKPMLHPIITLLDLLLEIMENLPNKEIIKQNLMQSELLQILKTPMAKKHIHNANAIISAITGLEIEEDPMEISNDNATNNEQVKLDAFTF